MQNQAPAALSIGWIAPLLFLVAMAAGCASDRSKAEAAATARRHHDSGYLAEHRFAFVQTLDTWALPSGPVDVAVLSPAGTGRHPLVVYMPGLGEPADAGALWRKAWAETGYVVLSFQAPAAGPAIWTTPLARAGDFRSLAREQFGPDALRARLALLREVVAEAARRGAGGLAPGLATAEFGRIAVAGFDLGAQTATAASGENAAALGGEIARDLHIVAAVSLSPYAEPTGTAYQARFGSIEVPVLAITSFQDGDPYGLTSSIAVRRLPYQYLPAGRGNHLLLLYAASHALLSGADRQPVEASRRADAPSDDSSVGMPSGGQGRGRGHGPGARRTPDGDSGSVPSAGEIAASRAVQIADVQAVSSAFLDAMVKSDPIAVEWLDRDARRWLGEMAELQWK